MIANQAQNIVMAVMGNFLASPPMSGISLVCTA
jgi:hypothetical protein